MLLDSVECFQEWLEIDYVGFYNVMIEAMKSYLISYFVARTNQIKGDCSSRDWSAVVKYGVM